MRLKVFTAAVIHIVVCWVMGNDTVIQAF